MEVIIGENGDLVIPKGMFLHTQFKPGQKVKINIESGKIIITPNSDAIIERFKELSRIVAINHIDSDDIHEQMIQERFGTE